MSSLVAGHFREEFTLACKREDCCLDEFAVDEFAAEANGEHAAALRLAIASSDPDAFVPPPQKHAEWIAGMKWLLKELTERQRRQ